MTNCTICIEKDEFVNDLKRVKMVVFKNEKLNKLNCITLNKFLKSSSKSTKRLISLNLH